MKVAPLFTYKNRLPQSALMGYISPAPHKTGAGIETPLTTQAHNRASGFFTCKASSRLFRIMAGRMGQPQGWPGSCVAGSLNPVRLATLSLRPLGGELSKLTTQGYPSWQTVNNASAIPAPTFSASIPKPKSPANSTVLTRSHTSFAPNYLTCLATACRYGFLPLWTTSPTISATFSDCLTSQRTPRSAPPMRPCSSGAFVHPVDREVRL
ncbi:ash family protein [Salmonella enterica subsp. enterica]|nr:ash family protein [Salmonella enterica subsp. enterica serovar Eastbourne]EDQ6177944.1 ash family protein [Salmonella enterica subsp. enterica serovar Javiana]EDR2882728.1 ash family protein [Salmonella enterica subsp. enterica]EHL2769450.1 ash family protein [Salmonella enterica subsp. enterica serovar Hvittingfoss]EDW0161878.1 ash family protein [Salmonella enterica subsp. enterica serovar Javiana]